MTPAIIVRENPDPQIRVTLSGLLMAYNERKTGPSDFAPLAVVSQDADSGELIGGLWGRTVYDWMFIEFLFVPEHLRGQGFGTTLLRKAARLHRRLPRQLRFPGTRLLSETRL